MMAQLSFQSSKDGQEKKASLSYHANNMHAPFQMKLYVTVQSNTLSYFLYPQWKIQNYELRKKILTVSVRYKKTK